MKNKIANEIAALERQLKQAGPFNRLYKYEIDGMIFFTPERNPQGMRLPTGRAKWTKEYFPVSGPLVKEIKQEEGGS